MQQPGEARALIASSKHGNGSVPVFPAIAVRLGKLFGDGAGIWTRMQAAYDTWHAERTEDVSRIPTIRTKAA